MTEDRPHKKLGMMLDSIARARDVRGAKRVSEHVKAANDGKGPGRSGWSQILLGQIRPSDVTMAYFKRAFDLTEHEEVELAIEFTFPAELAAA